MRLTTRSTRESRRSPCPGAAIAASASQEARLSTQSQTAVPLDLDPRDVEATLQPLERAAMLPPRAFVDPGVFQWELQTIFSGWLCVGHASRVAEPGSYLMREIGPTAWW